MARHYFYFWLTFIYLQSFAQISQKDSLQLSKEMYQWEKKFLVYKESQPALALELKAYPLYLKSLEISEKIGTKPNSEVLYQRISEYFAQEKQYEKAYTYLQKAKQMRDSLLKIEDMRTLNELQAKYDYQDQKYKISLLEKENEVKETQKSLQRNIFLFHFSIRWLRIFVVSV
jgi:tetratricopeptide (TPR) repeat protein